MRFLRGPNGPIICAGRTKTDFKDWGPSRFHIWWFWNFSFALFQRNPRGSYSVNASTQVLNPESCFSYGALGQRLDKSWTAPLCLLVSQTTHLLLSATAHKRSQRTGLSSVSRRVSRMHKWNLTDCRFCFWPSFFLTSFAEDASEQSDRSPPPSPNCSTSTAKAAGRLERDDVCERHRHKWSRLWSRREFRGWDAGGVFGRGGAQRSGLWRKTSKKKELVRQMWRLWGSSRGHGLWSTFKFIIFITSPFLDFIVSNQPQVCGSDGKTYPNSCELEYFSCRRYWAIVEVANYQTTD